MIFNTRSAPAVQHALLSPSNYHWINYDDDKMQRVYFANQAAIRGTQFHVLGHDLIRLGVKLPAAKKTLNLYVNDAIGFRMTPEKLLYYSDNCFGTADAIGFRKNLLRIHDLKTGVNEASIKQLEVYAALFCLEYLFKPSDIEIELRIYQNDEVRAHIPDPHDIFYIMDKIITLDKQIKELRMEELS